VYFRLLGLSGRTQRRDSIDAPDPKPPFNNQQLTLRRRLDQMRRPDQQTECVILGDPVHKYQR
jgi:hypothetical protein